MGKLKELMLDIEDDIAVIAQDGAADLVYEIQNRIDEIKDEIHELIDGENAELFYQYLGGDRDDYLAYVDNVVDSALSDEGISV